MNKKTICTFGKDEFQLLKSYYISGVRTTVNVIGSGGRCKTYEDVYKINDSNPGLGEIHIEGMGDDCIFEDEQLGMVLTQETSCYVGGGYTVTTQTLDISVYWK